MPQHNSRGADRLTVLGVLSILAALVCVFALTKGGAVAADYQIKEKYTQLIGGYYNITPTAVTDGGTGGAAMDANHNLYFVEAPPQVSWSLSNAAAVNATATAAQAADTSGRRHYCKSLQYDVWQDNTGTVSGAAGFTLEVLDGTAGGTVLWERTLSFPLATNGTAASGAVVFDPPLKGSVGTALTVRFRGASLAHTGNTINAQGFTK